MRSVDKSEFYRKRKKKIIYDEIKYDEDLNNLRHILKKINKIKKKFKY